MTINEAPTFKDINPNHIYKLLELTAWFANNYDYDQSAKILDEIKSMLAQLNCFDINTNVTLN